MIRMRDPRHFHVLLYGDHGGTTTMHMHACMHALLIVCDCGLNVEVKEDTCASLWG